MMEPEGQVRSNSVDMQGYIAVPSSEDPPTETVEVAPLPISDDNDTTELPYETSRTVSMEAQPSVSLLQASSQRCSLFLCETPSYDDDSSLSSHSVPDLRKSYAFVESTSTDDCDDEYCGDEDSESMSPDESTVPITTIHTFKYQPRTSRLATQQRTKSFPRYSLLLGFIVGCFIQSSSLGANYVLTVLFGHDLEELKEHHNKIMIFSLVWSLATSTMGVLVVLFLRSLLQAVPNASCQSQLNLWQIEYSFAFGALAGVCMAWCGTDVLLGFQAHAFHSLMTLVFAVIAKTILSCMARDGYNAERIFLDHDDYDDLEALPEDLAADGYFPLVDKYSSEEASTSSSMTLHTHFKIHGTILGVLIGFFIQMSSLGASFLLDTFAGQENGQLALNSESLLAFSLGWSFVFGSMGVMILLILRRLLMLVCHCIPKKEAGKLGLMLEFYFAVGCLVGVNLAWVLTDVGLGLQAHVMRSMLTLAASAVWCRFLACCFFSNRDLDDNEDDDEDVIFVDTLPGVAVRQQPEVYEAVLLA